MRVDHVDRLAFGRHRRLRSSGASIESSCRDAICEARLRQQAVRELVEHHRVRRERDGLFNACACLEECFWPS